MLNTIITFPGQGSYDQNFFSKEYNKYQLIRTIVKDASEYLGIDLQEIMIENEDKSKYKTTYYSQLITFISSYSLYKQIEDESSLEFHYFAGHSLGEVTALACAGVLSFKDTLSFIQKRAYSMEACAKENPGEMLAVFGLNEGAIQECIKGTALTISNFNSKEELIVSGTVEDILKLELDLSAKKVSTIRLKVTGAFHSGLMADAGQAISEYNLEYNKENLSKVISSSSGLQYCKEDDLINHLAQQITAPVRWTNVMEKVKQLNLSTIIEVGTKPVLSKFFRTTIPSATIINLSDPEFIVKIVAESHQNELILLKKIIAIAISTKNQTDAEGYAKFREDYQKLLLKCNNFLSEPEKIQKSDCMEFISSLFRQLLPFKNASQEELVFRENQLEDLFHIKEEQLWDF